MLRRRSVRFLSTSRRFRALLVALGALVTLSLLAAPGQITPGQAQGTGGLGSSGGAIIFGAWWDSNRDGAVTLDTDVHSLFRLDNSPDGAIRLTALTQQDARVPLIRRDGVVAFYLDRNNLLHNASRLISREPVLDSAYTPDGGRLLILTQPAGLPYRAVSLVDARTGQLVQFTGANVDDTSLSVSPDGTRVLFTQSFFGVNRLYSLDVRTGGVYPLTDGTFRVSSPRWSPNGSAIAYVRQVDTNRNGYDGSDPRTLWLTDANGVNQRQISPAGAVDAGTPIWAPDSFHIAFLHRSDNDANGRITPADALQLAVADVSTGTVNLVASGLEFPTVLWNSNGTRLAFRAISQDTNGDGVVSAEDAPILWAMGANDAVATPLTSGQGQFVGGVLEWAPAGGSPNRLAFTVATHDDNGDGRITQQDATQLYIAALDDTIVRPTRPVLDGPRIAAMAWSPDGAELALIVQTSNTLGTLTRADLATLSSTGSPTTAGAALAPLTDTSLIVDAETGLHWVR